MNITGLLNFRRPLTNGELKETDHFYFLIASSLKAVIEEFFVKVASSLLIICSCRRKSTSYYVQSVLQILFGSVLNINIQLACIDRRNPQRFRDASEIHLLLVDSLEAFLDIDVITFGGDYSNNKYYYIFLLQHDRYVQQDMKSIFSYCWNNYIINCNVQLLTANGEILLYTYFPFSDNKCDNYEPEHIDTFIGEFWVNRTYFHQKLKNFHGCPLVAAVRDAPPYLFVTTSAANATVSSYGFEKDMLQIIAEKMNFTLRLWTRIVDNHTIPFDSEVLKAVAERRADIAVGSYFRRAGNDSHFGTTFPHFQAQVVSILYMPAHMLNTFEVLLYPFQDYVWFGLGLSVAVILLITRLMRISRMQSISLFSIIACTIGAPIQQKPKLPHSVLLFTTWLWCSLIVRIIYSELWFQLLRYKVYSFVPQTFVEATNNNFEAVVNQFMYHDMQHISVLINSLNRTITVLPDDNEFVSLFYIEESNISDLFAVIYKDLFAHFVRRYRTRELFYVIPETMIQEQLCFYTLKHSHLIGQFDTEIMFLRAMGLFKFLSRKHFDYNYSVKDKMFENEFFQQKNLCGIYVVCCALYFTAFIIFLIEILSRKITLFARLFN